MLNAGYFLQIFKLHSDSYHQNKKKIIFRIT